MNKPVNRYEVLFKDGSRITFKAYTEEGVKTYVDLFFGNKEVVGIEQVI